MTYSMTDGFKASADKRNSLAYWFAKLEKIKGINLPETVIIPVNSKVYFNVMCEEDRVPEKDIQALKENAKKFGYPVFIRTSQSSDKHGWKNTCFVESEDKINDNLFNLLESNFMSDLVPDVLVLRKYIPMESYFTAWHGDFPVNKEVRCFIRNGDVECVHPYWPKDAIEQGMRYKKDTKWEKDYEKIIDITTEDRLAIMTQLSQVIPHFGDEWWSVDFAKGKDGVWYLIDMAVGLASFHFDGCKFKPEFKK